MKENDKTTNLTLPQLPLLENYNCFGLKVYCGHYGLTDWNAEQCEVVSVRIPLQIH